MKTKTLFLLAALLGFVVTSCQKTKPLEESSLDAANDATYSETVYDDVFASLEIATLIAEKTTKSGEVTDSCPVVTVTFPQGGSWPRNIVIDYGVSCTGLDGIIRSGKIIFSLSAPRRNTGSVRSVTFDNYYFNGVKIEGTTTVENIGPNNSQNVVFSVSLEGGRLTFANDSTIEREFDHEREYIAGYATNNPWDDECLISGSTTGKTYSGRHFTLTTTSALHWEAVCRFLVSGTVRIELEGIEPFDLDYGDSECDAKAIISRGDDSKEITLGLRHPRLPVGK